MKKYLASMRLLHWLSAILIIGLMASGIWMRTLTYYDEWYHPAPELHKAFGMISLILIAFRFVWRISHQLPQDLASHKPWEIKLAHVVHMLIYTLLAIILISGYLISSADDRTINIFDWFEFPALLPNFENQEDIAGFWHKWIAYSLIGLLILHIAGALKHQFVDKDGTINRML